MNQDQPPLHSIHKGTVHAIKDFGLFVELPGFPRNHGLVHVSQIAHHRVSSVEGELAGRTEVYVKVISLDGGKVALSMKVRDHSTRLVAQSLSPFHCMCYSLM